MEYTQKNLEVDNNVVLMYYMLTAKAERYWKKMGIKTIKKLDG